MQAAVTGLWFTFLAYWFVAAVFFRQGAGGTWWRGVTIRFVIVVAVVLIVRVLLPEHALRHVAQAQANGSPVVAGFGVAICALGVGFAIWARTHLGRSWGMPMSVREGSELVTRGPYAFVRHPIYTGILLAILGTAMVRWSVWSAVMLPVVFVYCVYAAKSEERSMTTRFPNQYPDYMNRTKMLVPLLF